MVKWKVYKSLFEGIDMDEYELMRSILNKHDFANLAPGFATSIDEYEFETALLCASINTDNGVSEAFDTVSYVFAYSFNLGLSDSELMSWSVKVAEEICKTVPGKPAGLISGVEAVELYIQETGVAQAMEQISAMAQEKGMQGQLLPHAVAKVMSMMN